MSDFRNRCLVIPVIDESEVSLTDSTMIVCWPSEKYKNILLHRNGISKYADAY
jgi:hypothetical protein